jgi:hypothetical protein
MLCKAPAMCILVIAPLKIFCPELFVQMVLQFWRQLRWRNIYLELMRQHQETEHLVSPQPKLVGPQQKSFQQIRALGGFFLILHTYVKVHCFFNYFISFFLCLLEQRIRAHILQNVCTHEGCAARLNEKRVLQRPWKGGPLGCRSMVQHMSNQGCPVTQPIRQEKKHHF